MQGVAVPRDSGSRIHEFLAVIEGGDGVRALLSSEGRRDVGAELVKGGSGVKGSADSGALARGGHV
jgi:hypothetical protein